MAGRKWTDEEYDYLRENYPTKTATQIASSLGRSLNAIHVMSFKMGVSAIERDNNPINWTAKRIKFLQDNFDKMTTEQLSDTTGLTCTVLRKKMKELGLRKCFHAFWQPECTEYLINNYQKIGDVELSEIFQEKFPKSHPWTKRQVEKKRKYLNLRRTKDDVDAIQVRNFEMGRFANCANKRWIVTGVAKEGEIRIWNKNAYAYHAIKIANSFMCNARYVWEKHHEKIPKGMIIRHIDGNSLNDDIENLRMITMIENYAFNSATLNLSDNYVVAMMTNKTPEKREELRKNKDLIELQRTIYKAKRLCKKLK